MTRQNSAACRAPLIAANDNGANVATLLPRQSSGFGFGPSSRAAQRRCDPLAFYADFPDRWRAFLHAHFRSAFDVAVFFSITPKAAEKWWQGIGGPQGAKLAYALDEIAGAEAWLIARRVAA